MSKRSPTGDISKYQKKPRKRSLSPGDNQTVIEEESSSIGTLSKYINNKTTLETLKKRGVLSLFPIQYSTYNEIYNGRDVMAKDRTGSGKTLAYVLPIIESLRNSDRLGSDSKTRFLIILPTRQLALQVQTEIRTLKHHSKDFQVVCVYGGASIRDQQQKLQKGAEVIVGTPGRLKHFLDKGDLKINSLKCICLDEADEMLKQGFKQDVEEIMGYIPDKKKTQVLLFSATIPDWLKQLSQEYQKDKKFIDMMKEQSNSTSKTITHYRMEAKKGSQCQTIQQLVKHFRLQGKKILIFCETKRQVNDLEYKIKFIRARKLHGDVQQNERQRTYKAYKEGKINCIIATNVAARGLDFPEVELVVQTQTPKNTEDYIHRSGRTGRAGKKGISVLLCQNGDYKVKHIEREAKIKFEEVSIKNQKGYEKEQRREDHRGENRGGDRERSYHGRDDRKKETRRDRSEDSNHSRNERKPRERQEQSVKKVERKRKVSEEDY